jgi:hypothetical protein
LIKLSSSSSERCFTTNTAHLPHRAGKSISLISFVKNYKSGNRLTREDSEHGINTGILGDGLTGLAVGYFLKQHGESFEILEKERECGGLMRSLQHDGFTFDYGDSHVIFSKDMEVLRFMLDLLEKNKLKNDETQK